MTFDWCFKCDTKHDLDEPCEGKMSVGYGTINVIADMMTGNYDKQEHIHTCVKCGSKMPHDVKDCHWPNPWACPDCEEL